MPSNRDQPERPRREPEIIPPGNDRPGRDSRWPPSHGFNERRSTHRVYVSRIGPFGFALLLFGPKRLPEIGNKVGKGMREFKDSLAGVKEEFQPALDPFHAPEDEQQTFVDHDAA